MTDPRDSFIIAVTHLDGAREAPHGATIVVDASAVDPVPMPLLVRLVLLRRLARSSGGDLVLRAGAETVALLERSGLRRSIRIVALAPADAA